MSDEKDVTVREGTIITLDGSRAGNLVEVGDVLRFDYFDALTELEGLIPQLVEKFKNSTAPELDQH